MGLEGLVLFNYYFMLHKYKSMYESCLVIYGHGIKHCIYNNSPLHPLIR